MSVVERRERGMALHAAETDAARAWSRLAPRHQTDKDVILAALCKSPKLPPKDDFERKFPRSLRLDRDVVLAFASRDDFEELYYDRHLFVPDSLTGDKQVMLAYCSKIRRSLQNCSEELCDDREVVQAAISLNGLELQYASSRLQQDRDIVVAACQNNGGALEFCPPGPLRQELTTDRDFMLSVLRKHGGPMLRYVSEPLRKDREMLLEALKHGMRFRACPWGLQTDKEFLLQALERRAELYLEVNRHLQADPDIALAAIEAEDSTPAVHSKAMQNVPNLIEDRNVVLAIAKRGDQDILKGLLTDGEHAIYCDDKAIMMAAIERDSELLSHASERLRDDTDILMVAIQETSAADVIRTLRSSTLLERPEIAIKAIQVGSAHCLRLLRTYLPRDIWRRRDVVIAWIRRGCPILEAASERLLQQDRELALEVAEHSWHDFAKVGSAFKSDREFMTEAIDRNGRVLRFATQTIREDLQFAIRAVASHPDSLAPTIRITKTDLQNHVKSKLDLHDTFLNDFLRGILAAPTPHLPPARQSPLPMLDCGLETSQAFKQLIAEFLGVPIGATLRIMRTALHNLTLPPRSVASATDAEAESRARMFMEHDDRWARRRMLRRRLLREADRDDGGDHPFAPPGVHFAFLPFGAVRRDPLENAAPNIPIGGDDRAEHVWAAELQAMMMMEE